MNTQNSSEARRRRILRRLPRASLWVSTVSGCPITGGLTIPTQNNASNEPNSTRSFGPTEAFKILRTHTPSFTYHRSIIANRSVRLHLASCIIAPQAWNEKVVLVPIQWKSRMSYKEACRSEKSRASSCRPSHHEREKSKIVCYRTGMRLLPFVRSKSEN